MMIFVFGLIALLLGFLFYGKLAERIIRPFRKTTPAYTLKTGWTTSRCLLGRTT